MKISPAVKNWEIGTTPSVLENIHQEDTNIAIYKRDKSILASEINHLLRQNIEFRASGDINSILDKITQTIKPNEFPLIIQDIKVLLHLFQKLSSAKSFRLLLITISSDMCRKFHTDINDLRMICTYSGAGTLWLTEDNINQKELYESGEDKDIVIEESEIQQAKTGSVVILKGLLYPKEGTRAVVHRSPAIEKMGAKRLLFRIDTNEFLNF